MRRARGEEIVYESQGTGSWPAHDKKAFIKPVVVLTSGRTFSAAEEFVQAFHAMKRDKLENPEYVGSASD
ncbi:S41 family peptidase [Rhodocytophaga aerolata]|uniref:S41 family peptidase n=1 Tax=Rhodocytophaga aerolata TaxID=455078 RepID=A0ABT8RB48_9BACT|nr:S41 family peptidase [Rhodocytophaga aerolata]MDO1449302.1 S41 family peptidase [Rhodocytophaga aerolata]